MRILTKPSPNFNKRTGVIDTLVLHYTGMRSMKEALDRLCDPASEVSCHYLIDEAGATYALVDETRRAWHAGVSSWQGDSNLNDRSIGIELVNPGHEFGYRPFPKEQMQALLELCRDILKLHAIPASRVLAHSDIAPARKQDPGELFDWQFLAHGGVGLWPDDQSAASDEDISVLLGKYGYQTGNIDLSLVITAFQRHFYPECITGTADPETTRRVLRLLQQ